MRIAVNHQRAEVGPADPEHLRAVSPCGNKEGVPDRNDVDDILARNYWSKISHHHWRGTILCVAVDIYGDWMYGEVLIMAQSVDCART